jgi:ribonuclease BN (tRNA processing enzyme)
MRLTVIGKSPAWADEGGACSCYLLSDGDTRLVVDCGSGAFGRLRAEVPYDAIDAVLISHMHGDHFLDLFPFAYALTLGPRGPIEPRPALRLPPGGRELLSSLGGLWDDADLIGDAFDVSGYEPGDELELGSIRVRTHPVPHFGPTNAVELTGTRGERIVYSADGRASDELAAAAVGAGLLVAEATLPEPDTSPDAGHMSASEAGAIATRSRVDRLVLTHISDELDHDAALAAARAAYDGPVEIAAPGASYDV